MSASAPGSPMPRRPSASGRRVPVLEDRLDHGPVLLHELPVAFRPGPRPGPPPARPARTGRCPRSPHRSRGRPRRGWPGAGRARPRPGCHRAAARPLRSWPPSRPWRRRSGPPSVSIRGTSTSRPSPARAASAAALASSLSNPSGTTICGRTTPVERGRSGRNRVSTSDIECLAIKKDLGVIPMRGIQQRGGNANSRKVGLFGGETSLGASGDELHTKFAVLT